VCHHRGDRGGRCPLTSLGLIRVFSSSSDIHVASLGVPVCAQTGVSVYRDCVTVFALGVPDGFDAGGRWNRMMVWVCWCFVRFVYSQGVSGGSV
jgi:hypothetical protein